MALTVAAALLGLVQLARTRRYAPVAWFLLMLLVWLVITN